jgi:hypothetical protein
MNTLTELWGEPSTGKTHQAHSGWPNPLHLDTVWTDMGFRELEVESDAEVGESWPVVQALYDWDDQEANKHYRLLDTWQQRPDIPDWCETVIVDNAADLRVIAANHWCQENGKDWPAQQHWGSINDMVDGLIRYLNQEHHVVVISQMKEEYQDGDKTGGRVRDGPKRMEFRADFRVRLQMSQENDRQAMLVKNRHLDRSNFPDWPHEMGETVSLDSLMSLAGIPEEAR